MRRYVYFIGAEKTGLIKIGVSKHPELRMMQLQTGSPDQLRLLRSVRCFRLSERGLHRILRQHRAHGEWFRPHPEVLDVMKRYRGRSPTGLAK